jgi:Fe-S oxidoreductase/nitrate reductase gamma subunit
MDLPHKESFFNIGPERYLNYLFALIALAFVGYHIYRRYRIWRLGKPELRFDRFPERVGLVLRYALGQLKMPRDPWAAVVHYGIFWGYLLLFVATTLDGTTYWLKTLTGYEILVGPTYLLYKALIGNLGGTLALIGLLAAFYWRLVVRPPRLRYQTEDWVILGLLLFNVLNGFEVQALRLAVTDIRQHPEWAYWAYGSYPLALLLSGLPDSVLRPIHWASWWVHVLASQFAVAFIAYSKLEHIIFGPLNIFFRSLEPRGTLKPIPDIETAETYGANRVPDFTWKQLLDADACIRCGRCTANCPANLTGKPLSPKKIILDLKAEMDRTGPLYLRGQQPDGPSLVGDITTDDELWDCLTCGACMEACPMEIEHVPTIVEERRYLVLNEGRIPRDVVTLFNNLERAGNPWGYPPATRADWARDLGIKTIAEDPSAEYLWWVGCAGSYDERNIRISRALAGVLQAAGVRFAILGPEETCNGDPARRAGHEYLYQILAQQNVETLNRYGVRKILTACPHCFNTLKNEYRAFGGFYEVVHHSQLIAGLVETGRIRLQRPLNQRLTYHDPCYLGRHNGVYDPPRSVLARLPGASLAEMQLHRHRAFCCGGGGARVFMTETRGHKRVNHERTDHVLAVNPNVIATACPFCMIMFEDALKTRNLTDRLQARDLAELVAESAGLDFK